MEIKSTVELENGAVEFTGTLDAEETSFLIEFAINHLLAMGVTPFLPDAPHQVTAGTETVN